MKLQHINMNQVVINFKCLNGFYSKIRKPPHTITTEYGQRFVFEMEKGTFFRLLDLDGDLHQITRNNKNAEKNKELEIVLVYDTFVMFDADYFNIKDI